MNAAAPEKSSSFAVGGRIGRYEVIRRLASGGMAELLLARASGVEGFEKLVVLKRILPHLADNAEFVDMFLREAKVAATLEHPNIVHVSDIGRADDAYFFAMAYLEGKDLSQVLRAAHKQKRAVSLECVFKIVTSVAAGLEYAHQKTNFKGQPLGIVHRDVSPQNIFLTYEGGVKLLDFGIAKGAAGTRVTRVGVRKGKAQYMSPEQCRGTKLDGRSDVFSLSIVLYEMTTMRRLFRGDDLVVMNKIISEDVPPPSTVVPDYPPGLDAIVLKGLARDPEQRFASAKELELALESFAREHGMLPSSAGIGVLLLDTFGPPAPVWDVERLESVSKGGPVTDSGTWAIPPSPAFGVLAGPEGAMASSPVPRPVRSSRAPDTRSRAGKSGKFVVPTDEDASASQSGLDSWTSSASSEIDAEYTPSVSTHGTRLTPAREDVPSNSGRLWWTLAIVGAVGGAAAFAFASRGSDDSPAVAASVPTSAVDAEPAAEVSQAALDTAQMLQLVNRTDFDSALELSERQRVLAILRKDPDYANAIDERLQRSLDLVQASQSPTPCLAFRDALEAIRAQPDASYRPALERARVPSAATGAVEAGTAPDKSCRGLQESLDALRVAVGDARTPAAPVAPVAEPEVPAEPPPKPTRSRRRHAKHDSSHSRSSPPPSEPQDEPETRPETPSEPPPAPVRRMEKLRDGELRPLGK